MHTINRGRSLVAVVFLTIAAQAVAQPTLDAIASHFPFREIGPTRQGGRVVAFGVTAGDPYRFFVGADPLVSQRVESLRGNSSPPGTKKN